MKRISTLILAILIIATAATVWAQCPDMIGQWSTTTGTMLSGRASEAWCGAGGNPIQGGQPGNEQIAYSWDGTMLSSQWKAWGMTIDATGAVQIGGSLDGSGNGVLTYMTNYNGGQFWLTKFHSWGDGVNDLNGVLNTFQVITTITFVGGAPVGATSNITFTGDFVGCSTTNGCTIRFAIANAHKVWDSNMGVPMPANYPPFACTANDGEFFDVPSITLDIFCTVAAEEKPWGTIKAMYK